MNMIAEESGKLIVCFGNPLTDIFGWVMLFLWSYVLHLLIREPILNWVAKKEQRREGMSD